MTGSPHADSATRRTTEDTPDGSECEDEFDSRAGSKRELEGRWRTGSSAMQQSGAMDPSERTHESATTGDSPEFSAPPRDAVLSRGPGYWPALPIALGLCLIPLDGVVREWVYSHRTTGDLRRELEFLQQFGAISSVVILMIVYLILDSRPREWKLARLLDWIAAAGTAGIAGHLLKIFIGRPRPLFNDPLHVLGPIGKYPVELKDGKLALIHAWDYSSGVASDLWSMPSSHALAAASLAVALTILYPSLRWLCAGLVIVVCVARVVLGAHYPSDVLVGVGIGWWTASVAMRSNWGSRLAAHFSPNASFARASVAA